MKDVRRYTAHVKNTCSKALPKIVFAEQSHIFFNQTKDFTMHEGLRGKGSDIGQEKASLESVESEKPDCHLKFFKFHVLKKKGKRTS